MNLFKPKTKIVEVKGKKFRLGKLDARTASYLCLKAAAIVAPAFGNGKVSAESLTKVLPTIPRTEFDEMQDTLLGTVVELNDVDGQLIPEPVLRDDGSFAKEEYAYDVTLVLTLTASALMFNIGDFFPAAGLIAKKAHLG